MKGMSLVQLIEKVVPTALLELFSGNGTLQTDFQREGIFPSGPVESW